MQWGNMEKFHQNKKCACTSIWYTRVYWNPYNLSYPYVIFLTHFPQTSLMSKFIYRVLLCNMAEILRPSYSEKSSYEHNTMCPSKQISHKAFLQTWCVLLNLDISTPLTKEVHVCWLCLGEAQMGSFWSLIWSKRAL